MKRRACTVEGCTLKYKAKGLCAKHYLRMWHYGNVHVAHPHWALKTTIEQVKQIQTSNKPIKTIAYEFGLTPGWVSYLRNCKYGTRVHK